nr:sigma-70 family RNA polymerase sigma factor [Duganella sp. sic0402]
MHVLYDSHYDWLRGWLRGKLGCAHEAADVAQDTFMRIIASRDALFGVQQQPRAYLTTTAKNLLIDRARRQLLRDAYLAELALVAESLGGYPSPQETMMALQALDQIALALERVSPKAREAFMLHYLDDQPQSVVAERLGVSTRMVQKYLVQALMQCRATCAVLAEAGA